MAIMNLDEGKRLYSSYSEAQREADRLTQAHRKGFQAYRVGANWAVGGVHMKKSKKIKSFEDLHQLLDMYKESDDDASVDAYISEIEKESLVTESEEVGASQNWILRNVSLKYGCDAGLSIHNKKTYLVLELSRDGQNLQLKMGGKFDVHIPLVKKLCDSLKDKAIRWHTWNSKVKKINWLPNEWFYLIEEDFSFVSGQKNVLK